MTYNVTMNDVVNLVWDDAVDAAVEALIADLPDNAERVKVMRQAFDKALEGVLGEIAYLVTHDSDRYITHAVKARLAARTDDEALGLEAAEEWNDIIESENWEDE